MGKKRRITMRKELGHWKYRPQYSNKITSREYNESERGKKTKAKSHAKRKEFAYIELNEWFEGSEGHHLDKEFVVYIPKDLHRKVWHSITKNIRMEEINAIALDFVYGD